MLMFFSGWAVGLALFVLALWLSGRGEEEGRPQWMEELGVQDERDWM